MWGISGTSANTMGKEKNLSASGKNELETIKKDKQRPETSMRGEES